MKKKVLIGIDLGGTSIKIGMVNEEYEIIARTSIRTNAERTYEEVIADMGQTAVTLTLRRRSSSARPTVK